MVYYWEVTDDRTVNMDRSTIEATTVKLKPESWQNERICCGTRLQFYP